MSKHERFEELAALAARGELGEPEVEELSLHLGDCENCRKLHEDFRELSAPMAEPLDAELAMVMEARREKIRAAVLKNTVGSERERLMGEKLGSRLEDRESLAGGRWFLATSVGAGVALAVGLALAFGLGMRYERRVSNRASEAPIVAPRAEAQPAPASATVELFSQRLVQSKANELESELKSERLQTAKLGAELRQKEQRLAEFDEREKELQAKVDALTREGERTGSLLTAKAEELRQAELRRQDDANTVVALRYQVADLRDKLKEQTEGLDRERQLLVRGREIRDIIGARNLHIIDVYDTEPDGQTKASFARAFYTEGKSLIFYAYDLPTRRTNGGQFTYTAWGQSNGKKEKVLNLGILLNDDKGQKRWVLNFSDPKVLSEIDSVFITLERVGYEGDKPTGKRLLTAYLANQPNHP